jgi:hypothetical protein
MKTVEDGLVIAACVRALRRRVLEFHPSAQGLGIADRLRGGWSYPGCKLRSYSVALR